MILCGWLGVKHQVSNYLPIPSNDKTKTNWYWDWHHSHLAPVKTLTENMFWLHMQLVTVLMPVSYVLVPDVTTKSHTVPSACGWHDWWSARWKPDTGSLFWLDSATFLGAAGRDRYTVSGSTNLPLVSGVQLDLVGRSGMCDLVEAMPALPGANRR